MIAVVLGGAVCVWDDLEAFSRVYSGPHLKIATNYAGVEYPGEIDHWASLHSGHFVRKEWLTKRTGPNGFTTWAPNGDVDCHLKNWGLGSSGLYAVTLAFHLGIQRVVLCGVPMDGQGNLDGRAFWTTQEYLTHRKGWKKNLHRIKDRVRSMSGWTRDLLGEPTLDWLGGIH